MTRFNIDVDGIAKRVQSESDRRKAFEATTPLLIFRHDWHDGMRTFKDIRAGEIGVLTYDKTPRFELHSTVYGSIPKGARLLRHLQATDEAALAELDAKIKQLHQQRRELVEAAWWHGEVVTADEVEGYVAARHAARMNDHS
jgi:hypothetical protein